MMGMSEDEDMLYSFGGGRTEKILGAKLFYLQATYSTIQLSDTSVFGIPYLHCPSISQQIV
jgi:hypothetical protein